jgi:hypothetical protein
MLDNYLWPFITSTGKRQGTIEVSPDTAQRILDNPGDNRHVIRSQVERYTRWMREGKWMDNTGGDLLFDVDGKTRGGQHRLLAQVESGVGVSYKVRWDQDEHEIAADNEGGRPWSAVDIAGGDAPNKKMRQTIAVNLLILDHFTGEIGARPNFNPGRLDVSEVVNDKRVIRAAEVGRSIQGTVPGISGSSVGTLYAIAANGPYGSGAPYFFEAVRTGAGMTLGDPALTLRNMLIGVSFKNLAQKSWQTMYVTARAWNYHVSDEKVQKLQRFTPPANNPVRPIGWKPFFPLKNA